MANSDIQLLFGVLGEGSLSGESGELIQSQLSSIISEINKNPLKVKVALDTANTGKNSWSNQLQSKLNAFSNESKFGVQISKLTLGAGAINDFKRQLAAAISTLNLDKGTTITIGADGIGQVKSQIQSLGDEAGKSVEELARFKVQMMELSHMRANVRNNLSSLENNATTDVEKEKISSLIKRYEDLAQTIEEVRLKKDLSENEFQDFKATGAKIIKDIIEMKGLGDATATATKQTADFKHQLEELGKISSSVGRDLATIKPNAAIGEEIEKIGKLEERYKAFKLALGTVKEDGVASDKRMKWLAKESAALQELIAKLNEEVIARKKAADIAASSSFQNQMEHINAMRSSIKGRIRALSDSAVKEEERKVVDGLIKDYDTLAKKINEVNRAKNFDTHSFQVLQEDGAKLESQIAKIEKLGTATATAEKNAATLRIQLRDFGNTSTSMGRDLSTIKANATIEEETKRLAKLEERYKSFVQLLEETRGAKVVTPERLEELTKESVAIQELIANLNEEVSARKRAADITASSSFQNQMGHLNDMRSSLKGRIRVLSDGVETEREKAVVDSLIQGYDTLEKKINAVNQAKSFETHSYQGLRDEGAELESQIARVEKFGTATATATENIVTFTMQLRGLRTAESSMRGDLKVLGKLDISGDDLKKLSSYRSLYDGLVRDITRVETKKPGTTVSLTDLVAQTNILRDNIAALREKAEAEKKVAEAADAAAFSVKLSRVKEQQSATRKSVNTFIGNATKKEADDVEQLTKRYWELEEEIRKVSRLGAMSNTSRDDLIKRSKAIEEEAIKLNQQTAAMQDNNAVKKQALTLLTQMQKAERDWTSARFGKTHNEYGNIQKGITDLQVYIAKLHAGEISVEQFKQKLTSLGIHFKENSDAIKAAGENTRSFGDKLAGVIKKFSFFFSATRVIMRAISTMRQMITNVRNIDASLTQLKIVTGATDAAMESFLIRSTKLAKDLGQSITDVLSSIETFSRLGYDLEDSSILAKFTGMLSNVAAVDTETATAGMTSIIKGYNMDVSAAEHVADVLVEVGQKYAVSASEMMEAYEKSGAALNASNTSFEKSAGLIAAANASVQNASTVGVALKTVSARIRGATSDLEELGENTDELAQGFSKYAKEIQALTGFDIMANGSTDTYKDIYDIFEGISKVWNDLSDTQQARISEILGGTRQLQVISSILGNWSDSAGAYADAMASAGTATEANAVYMESIGGKIGEFKATFQEFSNNFVDSWLIKFFVDLGTAIVNVFNEIEKLHMALPMMAAMIGTIATLRTGLAAARRAANTIETESTVRGIVSGLIAEKKATDNMIVAVSNLTIAQKAKVAAEIQAAVASGKLTEAESTQMLTALGLANVDELLTAQNHKLGLSFKALVGSISSLGWIAIALSVAIPVATALASSVKSNEEKLEELNDEFDDLNSKMQTASSNFQNLKASIDEVAPRFIELANGVNKFGGNVDLTDEEYDEFLQLSNKVAEMFPELNLGMDENGNTMLALAYDTDTLTQSFKDLVEAQRLVAAQEIADALPDLVENIKDQQAVFEDEKKKLESRKKAYETAKKGIKNYTPDNQEYLVETVFDVQSNSDSWERLKDKFTNLHGVVDWEGILNSNEFENVLAGIDRQIDATNNKIDALWNTAAPAVNSWLQTDAIYADMNDEMRKIAQTMVNGLDFSELGLDANGIRNYITDYIINPLYNAAPEVKEAFASITDWQDALDAGEITVDEFSENVRGTFNSLFSTMSSSEVESFKDLFVDAFNDVGIAGEDLSEVINSIIDDLSGLDQTDKIDELVQHLQALREELEALSAYGGNVDLSTRTGVPVTDDNVDAIHSWGVNADVGDKVTVKPSTFTDETTNTAIVVTPVLPNGEVLSKNELSDYIDELVSGAVNGDYTAGDESKIVIGIFGDSDSLDENMEKADEYAARIHEVQGEVVSTQDILGELLAKSANDASEKVESQKAGLQELADTLSNLQSAYDAVNKAQEEMGSGEGLSVETIESLSKIDSNYLDYLYEENGAVKLNTELWKENAGAKIKGDISGIQDEINALNKRNNVLQESIRYYKEQQAKGDSSGMLATMIDKATAELNQNNQAIATHQRELAVCNSMYGQITGNLDAYTSAMNNWGNVASSIDGVTNSLQTLADLQAAVANGFTMSIEKAMEFAAVYPEILNGAQATADGQIALNDSVVNSFIQGKQAELEADIDSQITALEERKAVLEARLAFAQAELELAKSVGDGEGQISKEVAEYRLDTANKLVAALIDAGVDEQTAFQLAAAAMAGDAQEFDRIAMEVCRDVNGNFNKAAYQAAQAIYRNMNSSKRDVASLATQAQQTAEAIAAMAKGIKGGSSSIVGGSGGGSINNGITLHLSGADFDGTDYTYEAKAISLDEFISDLEVDIAAYQKGINQINGQIAILEALKKKPLKSFRSDTGSGSGSGSGSKGNSAKEAEDAKKEVEEYTAEIDACYAALKKLESIQLKRNDIEVRIEDSENTEEKIALTKELIDIYGEESRATENLIQLRSSLIQSNIEELKARKFQIEYNAETNEFFVKNMERLNELKADSKGEYETLEEATNAYRKETEELINSTEELNSANQDSVKELRELKQGIKDSKDGIIEYLQDIVDAANEVVDGFQELYTALTDAAKEYAQNGFLSVDSLQAILELAPKYMSFLFNENGQLVLNEQALQKVIAARTEEMAAETALSYAKQVLLAAEQEEKQKLISLTQANEAASGSTWNMAYATLGLAKAVGTAKGMDARYFDDAVSHIQKMQSLSKTAVKSISDYYKTLDEGYISQKDGLDQILEITKEMIKHENEEMIDALEGQKDAFADIVALRKEALKAAKKEQDYDDDIEDKIRKIAKLQERINTLSLDDSRDAQAEKIKLEEEMYELQKELADSQADYTLEAQTDALDDIQDAYEGQKDDEIAALENTLLSEEKLYQAAIARINAGWEDLYSDLIEYNYNYGTQLESELVSAWDAASEAVQRYGSFVEALESVQDYTHVGEYDVPSAEEGNKTYTDTSGIISKMRKNSIDYWAASEAERRVIDKNQLDLAEQYRQVTGDNIQRTDGKWFSENGNRLYVLDQSEVINAIISRMRKNSAENLQTTSAARKKETNEENLILGARLGRYLGKDIHRDAKGVWWIGDRKLYDEYVLGGSTSTTTSGSTSSSASSSPSSQPVQNKGEIVSAIVTKMKQNSATNLQTTSAAVKKQTSDENLALGASLGKYLGKDVHRDAKGVWWIGNKKLYDVYHRGGIAGGHPTLKQNEVMAILKKGEPVLDEKREETLYRIVDFTAALSEKLGKTIKEFPLISPSAVTAQTGLPDLQEATRSITTNNNRTETIHFGDVYIYGASQETLEQHREINRQFTNEVLRHLNIRK